MDVFVKVVLVLGLFNASVPPLVLDSLGDDLLEQLVECAAMPRERIHASKLLVADLHRVMDQRWPGSKTIQFGSMIADVALYTSDVDCFVQLPTQPTYHTVHEARKLFTAHPQIFHKLNIQPNETVPLVQFTHLPTGHRCDVSFRRSDSIDQSRLLRYLLHLDKRARKLAIIIKYWAHKHKPRLAKKIMPNFAMVLLVVFYLQQKDILPPIIKLQENIREHVIINHWEVAYNNVPYRTTNNDTLFELLSGFFEFYAHFDFENNIISPFNGTVIERQLFGQLDTIPGIFDMYKENVAKNLTRPLYLESPVCIQNVFNHRRNIARATTQELLDTFRSNLKFAVENIGFRKHSLEDVFNEYECFRDSKYTNRLGSREALLIP